MIATVQPWEREVRDRDGRWWVLRVLPFRTADNRIDGATIVAVDIDLIKRSHELMEARDYALAIVQTVREPLVVLDADCRVGLANDAFYALFGETAGPDRGPGALGDRRAASGATPELRRAADGRRARASSRSSTSRSSGPSRAGPRTLVLNARRIVRAGPPDRCCCWRSTT